MAPEEARPQTGEDARADALRSPGPLRYGREVYVCKNCLSVSEPKKAGEMQGCAECGANLQTMRASRIIKAAGGRA